MNSEALRFEISKAALAIWPGHFSLISKLLLSLFNYLRKPDGAAESDRYSNVVSHPQVHSMDAATHVDLVMQAFTLIHTEERDN